MTIVHISSSLGGGGAEQMVFQLAKQSNAITKTVVISISEVNTLEHKFNDENIEVHFLNITSFKNRTLFLGLKKTHDIVNGLPDVVFHCHQFHGGLFGMLYNIWYSRIPIVYTMHTNQVSSFVRRACLYVSKPLRKRDIIFSENSKKWYLKNNEIIPNGVDFKLLSLNKQRKYDSSQPFVFLFLGRLSPPKNPLALPYFAKKLKENGFFNFIIHVIGEGSLREQLWEEISKNNLKEHFKLFGFQKDVKQFLEHSQSLILPSLWEGMPMAVIEAAANKLPVIATPVGSVPDFLNEHNAYVSNLESFSEAMIHVMKNYSEALSKSELLYKEIKTIFSIESVHNKHFDVYRSVR
ncbi:glycosyltransferase [Mangrovimonas sp. YM274]|uniref:glycosyltransferase n=1 Tax=Mangrovimonas sp. YM274 TaxID=3070660 RepID=UPI0027DAE3AC|nr:glycosyltransferase [Mangrovimonas sp. YM274]WMI67272.1 glycosyltransferase [Mangrovimonas sp. YM274]